MSFTIGNWYILKEYPNAPQKIWRGIEITDVKLSGLRKYLLGGKVWMTGSLLETADDGKDEDDD